MILDLTHILLIALAVLVVALIGWVIRLEIKLKHFLVGTGARNLEDSFIHMNKEIEDFRAFRKELELYLTNVEKRIRRSVQGVHTLRFNPFKGTGGGGNQSFATAIINEEGDGVILSSLYSREHVSIFSKPVKSHVSEFELSEEEREALAKAKHSLSSSTDEEK